MNNQNKVRIYFEDSNPFVDNSDFQKSNIDDQLDPWNILRLTPSVDIAPSSIDKTKKIFKNNKNRHPQPRGSSLQEQSFGRPPNKVAQKEHLQQSRSLNDVIYHYARLLIFLKIKQGSDPSTHTLYLQNQQNILMCQTQKIMNTQTFPNLEEPKPVFSLHSNTLHFVFQYHKQHSKRRKYFPTQLKIMFLAFLKKKKILSSSIYHYVNQYWHDIIHLVKHPEGDQEIDSEFSNALYEGLVNRGHSDSVSGSGINEEGISSVRRENSGSPQRKKDDNFRDGTQLHVLKRQLQEDETIAAYQIACYLHSCCKKYKLIIEEDQ